MQIKIENLAPKLILNFYPAEKKLPSGGLWFAEKNLSITGSLSLVNAIMQISGVERCLVTPDMVSVKYNGNADEIKMLTMAEIDDFVNAPLQNIAPQNDLPLKACVEAVADAFIRPTLNRDNGDIKIIGINSEGVLELEFTGHCAGCPYAVNTLQNVIVRTFQKYMPQITDIKLKEV